LTEEFKAQTWAIEDQNGSLKTYVYEIAETWRQYCQKLYSKEDIQEEELEINESDNMGEPNTLKDEIQTAIKKLGKGKAPGPDNLIAEIITASGELRIELLHKLCNKIWNTKQWPMDWT
jgi:hypothetical protein